MMKKSIRIAVSLIMCLSLLLGAFSCGSSKVPEDGSSGSSEGSSGEASAEASEEASGEGPVSMFSADNSSSKSGSTLFVRPMLLDVSLFTTNADTVKASVAAYSVDSDLGNLINSDRIYVNDEGKEHLIDDGFFVEQSGNAEFFEIYEYNRYSQTPNFVTVDSLMHSYHLFFSYVLKKTEKAYLYDMLVELTDRMLSLCEEQKSDMAATGDWEVACDRNIAFFAVAKALLDPSYDPSSDKGVDEHALEIAKAELDLVNAESGIEYSPLSGGTEYEDYSQYKPRGYYDTDETLKKYFKAMMWYGRRNFSQKDESLDRSAMLMSAAMDEESFKIWSTIYAVTSFFAGASDDNGVCEYRPIIQDVYGKSVDTISPKELADDGNFAAFHEETGKLEPPAINSVPMDDDNGETDKVEVSKGFRFMGQRFSVDAAIFQKLIYSSVGENSGGDKRLLPDALDVPAAMSSKTAEKILKDEIKAFDYADYGENLSKLQDAVSSAGDETWYASLYSEWLNTLRPLLEEKGSGYPYFMQTDNWRRKSLEGFLGSYTELKHDTVLYSEQVIAEMGGPDDEVDYRGYVEPEPVIYKRFSELAQGTKTGLEKFDLLDSDTSDDLDKLTDIADRLYTISEKELREETLTDDEYDFIEIYGGEIEHFWIEAYKDEASGESMDPRQFPSPLVVDVATDPNGSVLELANGEVGVIYVVVPVDGTLRIAKGSVYNFYQFEQPIDQRMTDHEWRIKLGIDADDNGEYHWDGDEIPDKPSWTDPYWVEWK